MFSRSGFDWARVALGSVLTMALAACTLDERAVRLTATDAGPVGRGGLGAGGTGDSLVAGSGGTITGATPPDSEQGPAPTTLTPPEGTDIGSEGEAAGAGSCIEGSSESCGPEREEGICRFGTRTCTGGVWGECVGPVLPAARDCSSEADNDCDGQPDSTVDDVCRCPVGGTRACDEHPELDGKGPCVAGSQTCVVGAENQTSDWGACEGSVGPSAGDSCEIPGDDADCDGSPNGGCTCVNGATVPCGPNSDEGICQRGTSTCTNNAFGPCLGAVFPDRRDCTSPSDNDCDGLPDDTVDATCTCEVGGTRACGTHPGRDGIGPCRAGSQTCVAGNQSGSSSFNACTGSVGPAQRDSCTVFGDDSDCSGVSNSGCQCVAGRGNQPCAGDPNNSRCNAQGQCAPCQANADCSLVSGGRNLCTAGVCSAARCGDGVTSANEQCDDGNSIDTDSCTASCRFAACGDGFLQLDNDEECDDRNTVNGDGCSNVCRIARTPHGAVSFGAYHVCTPLASGRVMCWGSNAFGQLGTGNTLSSTQPVLVLNLNNAAEVALSDIATCARTTSNTVSCWGTNSGGNLGAANAADSTSPVPVTNLSNVVQVAGGGSGFCAVLSSGSVMCWGDTIPVAGGVTQKNVFGVVQIAAGNAHFCGVRGDGTLVCWGSNTSGQFGNGVQASNDPTPVETGIIDVAEVAAGGDTTCVRLRSGSVRCFGSGTSGQLGNNASVSSLVPVTVQGNLTNAVKLAGATEHFCALTSAQDVRCWGATLGGGGDNVATTILLPSTPIDIGSGAEASCALLDDDSVHCWGSGFAGQLGTGMVLNNGSATPLRALNIP